MCDADPIDLYAYHILAYDGAGLVGCVRVYPLVSNGLPCLAEKVLGRQTFSEMLCHLGAKRREIVEIGRWIVEPAYRASGRPGIQLAAASAALAITLGNGLLFQRTIIVCSAGTRDRQDLMLARIGLSTVPAAEAIKCDEFKDYVRVMYCLNPQQLNPRFLRLMVKMAKTIGLTQAFSEINQTLTEGDFEDTDTSAGKLPAEQSASFRVGPQRQKWRRLPKSHRLLTRTF